jgi:hypothetical protein
MKNVFVLFLVFISLIFNSCTDKNPIWETAAMDPTYATGFPLDRFHQFGIAGDTAAQHDIVNQYRKVLTRNVFAHYPCIQDEKNIHFVFGSGSVKHVLSADGNTYSGDFDNELVIILTDSCVQDTLFLACGNGMLSPIRFTQSSDWGTAEKCRYKIQTGEGLATYLPQLQAWANTATELDIPIRDQAGKVVKGETYLNYLGRYESVLFTGDIIDMCQGKVFNAAGQEVQFEKRLAETKKANALSKKKFKKHRR